MSKSHLQSNTPEYQSYHAMKKRCLNPNSNDYHRYGGRGITVCDRWLESFENFIADMGKKPDSDYSIGRIDNDKGYSPENCRWETAKEQMNNKSTNHVITFNGKTQTLTEWADELKMPFNMLRRRLKLGWSIEDAFTIDKIEMSIKLAQKKYVESVKKTAKLITPDGFEIITKDITKFAVEHNLIPQNVHRLLRGERKTLKGWRGNYL